MIITNEEIQKIYMDVYPDLKIHYAMPFSEKFIRTKFYDEFWLLYLQYKVSGISHIPNIRDCEKRAWKVVADIQWDIALSAEHFEEEEKLTRTIGWMTGFKMPFQTSHTIITTYSELGIMNIDPLTDKIEGADINKFNSLLLVM